MPNPIDNMQPSLALTEVMLTQGVYPSASSGGDATSLAAIRHFGFNFAPSGTIETLGQLLPIASNTALFSLLGTTYGGNGQTTFALPNLQSRVPVHFGQGPGLSSYSLGQQAGTETATLNVNSMPQHIHPVTHTRLPHYVRGRLGTIEINHGCHVFPDVNSLGQGEDPHWLYTVRFDGRELWGKDGDPTLSVSVDAWEPYLERA